MMIMSIMNAPIDYKRSRVIIMEQHSIVIMEDQFAVYGATSNVIMLPYSLYITLPYGPPCYDSLTSLLDNSYVFRSDNSLISLVCDYLLILLYDNSLFFFV